MRLVVADESPVFAHGLSLLLHEVDGRRAEVVASTDDARAVAATVRRHSPDLAVVSLGLADPGGVRAIAAVRRADPAMPVVAMAAPDAEQARVAALSSGAVACLDRTGQPGELVSALLAVVDGWAVVPRSVLAALLAAGHRDGPAPSRLTAGEVRLWQLVASGLTSAGIAGRLHVSERTAKRQVAALLRRLEVSSRTEAARLAGSVGLTDGRV